MPWNSNYNDNMQGACKEIPGDARRDQGYSTPDVYGRAVQFYLALERAAQTQDFASEAVVMWRALLSMLALRNMLDLPLVWNYVQISPGDPLSNALSYPPKDANQLLYPNSTQYQWDGQTFYTLSWAPEGQDPIELAIYSPMTLIYPVADWKKIFSNIPQLNKFFRAGEFQSHSQSIQGGELNFVYPWLRDMREHLNGDGGASNAKRNIILHLDRYMSELGARDKSLSANADKLPLKPQKFGFTTMLSNLVPQLLTAYDIGGPVFSDQLCVLRVDASEGNPFAPCQYSENYKILGGPLESGVNLYAFLPIHPNRREECRQNGIAESITMRLHTEREGAELKHYIHVSASTSDLPGIRLEKDYLLVEGESAEKNVAVYYKNEYNEKAELNRDTWPLFSVWPTTLDAKWNQYYIMRSSTADDLRVSGEPGTPEPEGAAVEMGDNKWVVKTSYVPDAIPIVRVVRDEDGRLTDQSRAVGMLTPDSGTSVEGTGKAIVAVDFGTSSTRVFYSLSGNNQPVHEIPVVQDKPLEVTRYEDSVSRRWEMSTFFISPGDPKQADDTLFSIFRRSEDKNRPKVRPLLDGAIYQPRGMVDPHGTQFLVTDLKWNGAYARPYYIAFMQQLCLHIMTYLYQKYQVADIEWHYALPRVMNQTNQNSMNSIWQNEILGFLKQVSANSSANAISHRATAPSSSDLPLLTESIAASRYFDHYRSNEILPVKGYLVVDVGGGSTDVALWQKSGVRPTALKWHSSVRVAGRKMFTQWIEQYINDLAAGINDPETASLLRTINEGDFSKHSDAGAKEALVDRLLTTDIDNLHANYKTNLTTEANGWGSALRDKITQAVALLMFSLGYQIGVLMNPEAWQKPNEQTNPNTPPPSARYEIKPGPGYFTIAFGGRGSNVLKWLECGDVILANFFKDGISAAGASWPKVDIHLLTSDDPKCEVAKGLLVSSIQGSPTGWEDVGNKEVMEDVYYYADEDSEEEFDDSGTPKLAKKGAATAFYDAFKRYFPGNFNIKDLSQSELAIVAIRAIGANAYVDDVFKVLMESIYDVLESQ